MPSFDTEHGAIYYEVLNATGQPAGAVPTLVLLHNFMSSGRATWGPMLDSLFLHYRVLLPDLPGHGRSLGHPQNFDHGIMAQQLAGLLAAEGATDAHLAGCSSGGMIAQLLVHHGLINPSSLLLVSTTYSTSRSVLGTSGLEPRHFSASRTWREATAKLHDHHRREGYAIGGNDGHGSSHYVDPRDSDSQDRDLLDSDGAGYYERVLLPGFRRLCPETAIDLPLPALANWTLPVCLIHGEQDEFFPVAVAEEMAETLPNARLHLVPEQSHALIFRQPWKVLRLMISFLTDCGVERRYSADSAEEGD